jgi:hypothetical protein
MTPEIRDFLTATWALASAWLLQPMAAGIVGGFAAGYAIGTAKNKTAFVEIGRGILAGFAAGAIVTAVQLIIVNGGTQ